MEEERDNSKTGKTGKRSEKVKNRQKAEEEA